MGRTYVDLTEQVTWPSWASGAVLLGAGAAQPTVVSPGSSGNLLTSNGSAWVSAAPASQRGEVAGRSSTATQTISTVYTTWVYTGSTSATWTLPPVAGNTGFKLIIENATVYPITLQRNGSDLIWLRGASTTGSVVAPGASLTMVNDGSYWQTLSVDLANNAASLTSLPLITPTITGYTETCYNAGTVSTAWTINLANGTMQRCVLTNATTCAVTMPTAFAGMNFAIAINQPSTTGSGLVTFSGVQWPGGTTPTMSQGANVVDMFTFFCFDGSTIRGAAIQAYPT